MDFKKPTLEDKPLIDSYLKQVERFGCEYTFANFYLWSSFYHVTYTVIDDMLVFHSCGESGDGCAYLFPIGSGDFRPIMEQLMAYCEEKNIPFRMYGITPDIKEKIEAAYPDTFDFTDDRDSADYIYNSEDLIGLTGKKYHGKRNHINKFKEGGDWSYETITRENIDECLEMNKNWCLQSGCDDSESKQAEQCVVRSSFKHFETLGLRGGLIRQNGRVVAFSLGEPINDKVFVVHIEKAYSDVQGAYPMINREFVEHEAADYPYINREEDMGIEGLRKAKLSYRPAFLVEKSVLTKKSDRVEQDDE